MNFNPSRAEALNNLNNFIENNLSEYSKLRNFDFGPTNRSNISCLSPYITHGVINELEVINKSLKNYLLQKLKNLFKKFSGEFIGKAG
jgi:deoxyribodipyrimidine photo-lyase